MEPWLCARVVKALHLCGRRAAWPRCVCRSLPVPTHVHTNAREDRQVRVGGLRLIKAACCGHMHTHTTDTHPPGTCVL